MTAPRRAVPAAALVVVGALGLGGCGAPSLTATEAEQVAVHALEAAELRPGRPTEVRREVVDVPGVDDLGQPRRDEAWLVELPVDGARWTVGVDPEAGRVVRTFEPPGAELSSAQVDALAEFREHPRADRADRRRRQGALAGTAVVLLAGYAVLRTLARRHPTP